MSPGLNKSYGTFFVGMFLRNIRLKSPNIGHITYRKGWSYRTKHQTIFLKRGYLSVGLTFVPICEKNLHLKPKCELYTGFGHIVLKNVFFCRNAEFCNFVL